MSIGNPFKKISTDNVDRVKNKLEQQIKDKAWQITKKVPFGKMTSKDIDEMESLYKNYFKKYPDTKNELSCKQRIAKLRRII